MSAPITCLGGNKSFFSKYPCQGHRHSLTFYPNHFLFSPFTNSALVQSTVITHIKIFVMSCLSSIFTLLLFKLFFTKQHVCFLPFVFLSSFCYISFSSSFPFLFLSFTFFFPSFLSSLSSSLILKTSI